jgi:hypothetical protein
VLSSPIPYSKNPTMRDTKPISINAIDTVLNLLGNSKRYLIEEEAILNFLFLEQLLFSLNYFGLAVESF